MHIIDAYSKRIFDDCNYDKHTDIFYDENDRNIVDSIILLNKKDLFAVVHMARTWKNRTPEVNVWEGILRKYYAYKVIVVGTSADLYIRKENTIDMRNRFSINQLCYLISKARIFISNDSGILHIAGATQTKILGVFTAAKAEFRLPFRNGKLGYMAEAIIPDIDCYGCLHEEPPPVTYCECRWNNYECLNRIKYSINIHNHFDKIKNAHRLEDAQEQIAHPVVSIIIPLFNRVDFTQKCLEALYQNTVDGLYELLIIDNASTDGTKVFLQTIAKTNLKVITNDTNLGFAKACNQGAQIASTDYVLFLNNDTEPLKGWLEPLLDIIQNDDSVVAVGSKLLYPDMTIQQAGIVIVNDKPGNDALQARNNHVNKPATMPDANDITLYQALTAACLLIRREAFQQAGAFDEEYWNGYEDVDLCFKLQELGKKIVYQPSSVVIHHESKSGRERFINAQVNISRLHKKWLGRIKPDIILNNDGTSTLTDAGKIRPYRSPEAATRSLKSTLMPLKNNLVSIIVLTFNQLEQTQLCLKSIERYTPQPYELILVNNGSTDGTLDYLRKYADDHGNVCIIANKENLGFAAGNNQGLGLANGNYLLLLNNDTVVTEGWLGRMLSVFERYLEVGIVGPVSNYVSGPQQVKGASYQNLEKMHHFAKQWSVEHKGQTIEFQRVVGFCLLAKREVIDRIGGLDERFGSGNFEDDDFCLRAAAAGYKARIALDAFIHHTGSQTFKGAGINYQQILERNWEIFKTKWQLPQDLPFGANYTLNLDARDLSQYYIPLKGQAGFFQSTTIEDGPSLTHPEFIEGMTSLQWSGAVSPWTGKEKDKGKNKIKSSRTPVNSIVRLFPYV